MVSKNSDEKHMRQVADCTRGIVFLGTPHRGTDLASIASNFAKLAKLVKPTAVDIVGVLQPNSEVLERIFEGFNTMLKARQSQETPPIEIMCFFEEVPMSGSGLVSPLVFCMIRLSTDEDIDCTKGFRHTPRLPLSVNPRQSQRHCEVPRSVRWRLLRCV